MRTASRAFDVILRAQGLSVFPRLQLDIVVRKLAEISESDSSDRERMLEYFSFGIQNVFIFHGFRPFLFRRGYTEKTKKIVFNDIIRASKVDYIFIPLRDPYEALLSEYNRAVANKLGNWIFSLSDHYFLNGFDLINSKNRSEFYVKPIKKNVLVRWASKFSPSVHVLSKHDIEVDPEQLNYVQGMVEKQLEFLSQFYPRVKFLNYKTLLTNPDEVFSSMATASGFEIADRSIFHVKVNSLGNRFLCRNPLRLRYNGIYVDVFIEVQSIAPFCSDRGFLHILPYDISSLVPNIRSHFSETMVLAIPMDQYNTLPMELVEILTNGLLLVCCFDQILSRFDDEFVFHLRSYRELNVNQLPPKILDFWGDSLESERSFVEGLL